NHVRVPIGPGVGVTIDLAIVSDAGVVQTVRRRACGIVLVFRNPGLGWLGTRLRDPGGGAAASRGRVPSHPKPEAPRPQQSRPFNLEFAGLFRRFIAMEAALAQPCVET